MPIIQQNFSKKFNDSTFAATNISYYYYQPISKTACEKNIEFEKLNRTNFKSKRKVKSIKAKFFCVTIAEQTNKM